MAFENNGGKLVKIKRQWKTMVAVATLFAVSAGTVSATTITFDLGNGPGYNYEWSNSFSVSSGDYTLTFTDPGGKPFEPTWEFEGQTVGDPTWANGLAFERDTDGLVIGGYWVWNTPTGSSPQPGYTNSFTMTSTGPTNLILTGYRVEFVLPPITTPFSLSQGATTLSSNNSLSAVGDYSISGGSVFMANGASLLFQTPWTSEPGLSQISSLTFEITAVPEPSTYAMALAGLACGGYTMWRRRKRA
jgi:hypothetical protein